MLDTQRLRIFDFMTIGDVIFAKINKQQERRNKNGFSHTIFK